MRNRTLDINRLFYLFLLIHLIGWTVVPALVRDNLPLDSVEASIWGHQLEWGYDKNPYLIGWLAHVATSIGHGADWPVYFFSQLSVAVCLLCVWLIAKRMLPAPAALLSVLLLEGIQYFNLHSIDFNDNTLELGLWGGAILMCYKALASPHKNSDSRLHATPRLFSLPTLYWLLTGLFAGLGVVTKYYTLALIAGMALFLFSSKANRQQLVSPAPWLGLGIFLVVISPHLLWLTSHDYITVRYMLERASSNAPHLRHIEFPLRFTINQLLVFVSGSLLFLTFLIGKRPVLSQQRNSLSSFDSRFLFYVGLCPFLLTLLLSIVFDIQLRAGWGTPLQSLWGIMLVSLVQPQLSEAKIRRAFVIVISLMCTIWFAYAISILYSTDTASANFPGRDVASKITREWHQRYGTQLSYLAGSRWAAGNVARYSADKPAVMINYDVKRSPWTSDEELEKHGAVFIWDITGDENLPAHIRQRFPMLSKAEIMQYDWRHNYYHLPKGKIGIAFLPPRGDSSLRSE